MGALKRGEFEKTVALEPSRRPGSEKQRASPAQMPSPHEHGLPYANSFSAIETISAEFGPQEIHLLVVNTNKLLNLTDVTIRKVTTFHYRRLTALSDEELRRTMFRQAPIAGMYVERLNNAL